MKPLKLGFSLQAINELDEEKGPQIRVEQDQEHAAFMNLWKGKMAVHKGRKGESKSKARLFLVKGECPEEACAFQVKCELNSLRSRGAFILLEGQNKAFVWKGQGMPDHKSLVIDSLKANWNELTDSIIQDETEGQESPAFKSILGFNQGRYHANLPVPSASMRLYHMSSLSGEFQVDEVACLSLNEAVPNVLSFNQPDLYKAEQPGKNLKCVHF